LYFEGIRRPPLDELAAFDPAPVPFFPVRRFTQIGIGKSILTFHIRSPAFPVNAKQNFVRCLYFIFLEQCPDGFEHGSRLLDYAFASVHDSSSLEKFFFFPSDFLSADPD
jgi:hypothetical protein